MVKKAMSTLLAAALAFSLAACGGGSRSGGSQSGDSSVQAEEKTVITALCYTELPQFEALVESTYGDIDLEIELGAVSTYNSDTLRRLRNGHGKDLVFTSMPNSEIAGYVLDLSANAFTTNFNSSVMSAVMREGKTVWLPMPSVYKGLIVNKTLAQELGKELPATQQELLGLLAAAKAQGIGVDEDGFAFTVADIDGISVGEMIVGTMVPDFLGTMEGERWTNSFMKGGAKAEGSLEGRCPFLWPCRRKDIWTRPTSM